MLQLKALKVGIEDKEIRAEIDTLIEAIRKHGEIRLFEDNY